MKPGGTAFNRKVAKVNRIGHSLRGSLQKHLKKVLHFYPKIEIEMRKFGLLQHFFRSWSRAAERPESGQVDK